MSWMPTLIIWQKLERKRKVRKSIPSHFREITSCPSDKFALQFKWKTLLCIQHQSEQSAESVKVNRKFKRFMYFKILFHFVEYWLEQKPLMHSFFKKMHQSLNLFSLSNWTLWETWIKSAHYRLSKKGTHYIMPLKKWKYIQAWKLWIFNEFCKSQYWCFHQ